MAEAQPVMVVRVTANITELRKVMKEGTNEILTTKSEMAKFSNAFDGSRIVSQAGAVVAQIKAIGGVTNMTTAEQIRANRVLEEAIEKYRMLGREVPPSLTMAHERLTFMTRAAEKADASGAQLSDTYRQFDGILQSMGINIGPYVKGLEDVFSLVAKGMPSMFSLGGAIAVVGTALAAWNIGTRIGEMTGWTDAIAKATAEMRGFGDVAQEEGLARQQSAELAGHAEKMWKLQAEGTAAATKASEAHTAELQREGMATAGNAAHMTALANQLAKVKEERRQAAAAAMLSAGATDTETEATKRGNEALKEREESVKRIIEAEAARKKQVDDFMNADTLNDRQNPTNTFDVTRLTQTELDRTNRQFDPFGRGGNFGAQERLRQLEALEGTYAPKNKQQYLQMLADMLELARLRMTLGGGNIPGFANGVSNFRGGMAVVGERGPELVRLPRGADVVPNGQMGGVVINLGGVHVSGSATRRDGEIAGRAIVDHLRSVGQLLPSGGGA